MSVLQASHSWLFFLSGRLSPFSSTSRWAELMAGYNGFLMMLSAKTIATLASVAVIGCSLFAFSWVGLALLGF
jgi:hypothetical protein